MEIVRSSESGRREEVEVMEGEIRAVVEERWWSGRVGSMGRRAVSVVSETSARRGAGREGGVAERKETLGG